MPIRLPNKWAEYYLREGRGKRSIYTLLMLSFITVIVLTILILSAVLYMNFEKIVLDQLNAYNMDGLNQINQDVAIMMETAGSLSNQIYSDLYVSKLLNYTNPNINDITTGLDQLNKYRLSMPFIDSIYIYNENDEVMFESSDSIGHPIEIKKDFYDQEIFSIIKNYQNYSSLSPIPRKLKTTISISNESERYIYSFLYYNKLTDANKLKTAVVVNISENWLHRVMNNKLSNSDASTYFIDRKGVLVTDTWKYPMLTDISNKVFIKRIIDLNNEPGYFTENVDGKKFLITASSPNLTGWRCVRLIPYDNVMSRVNRMRSITVVVCVALILFGLLASYMVSRNVYKPINGLLLKLSALEAEKRNSFFTLKHLLLTDILTGKENCDLNALKNKLDEYNVRFDPAAGFTVVLLKIDDYKAFLSENNSDNRRLYRFQIMNICSEILTPFFSNETVELEEDSIAVILNMPTGAEGPHAGRLEALIGNIRAVVQNQLDVSLSAAISERRDSVANLPYLLDQAKEASLYRLFRGHGCINHSARIMRFKEKQYAYPIEKEKSLVDAILQDRLPEAKRIYLEMVEEIAENEFSVIRMASSRLFLTINNTIRSIQKNIIKSENYRADLLMSVDEAETIDEIHSRVFSILDHLSAQLDEKRGSKHESLVGSIVKKIETEYMNQGLSLESVADEFRLTPSYVGRLFKQYTMKTVVDYIIEVRMRNACELLRNHKYSVADVAHSTGFSNSSYFYKAFKKNKGLTPNEYRRSVS